MAEVESELALAVCETCDGEGFVCTGFGLYSDMRIGIAQCPDCNPRPEQREQQKAKS